MQYTMDPAVSSGYLPENDAIAESMNLLQLDNQQWNQLDDGTIEITDRMPKKEYYLSLRRLPTAGPNGNTLHPLGSISSGSGVALANGAHNPTSTSPRQSGGTLKGRSKTATIDFKPSGKTVDCSVVMLDGTTREFRLDKCAYGQHLFDAVCSHLGLLETEIFGITYYDSMNTWFWLDMDQKISKQIGKGGWHFEFQVKFYPFDLDTIGEDLTRYYLCLQVRQDIVSGQLPCSFVTYCILGSYILQSEAGDHDPTRNGVAYIEGHPLAPSVLQTREMLERMVELHKLHRGKTPEEADRLFLNNARKLALYGVDFHKVKTPQGQDLTLGVCHSGILLYRNRIRLMRISWVRIITLKHRGRNFIIELRPDANDSVDRIMTFKCMSAALTKRLFDACVSHHTFFRLRGSSRPRKPSIFPSFAARKYHYPGSFSHSPILDGTVQQGARTLSKFRPMPSHPNDTAWFTLANRSEMGHLNGAIASQYQYQPAMMADGETALSPVYVDNQQFTNGHPLSSVANGAQRYFNPNANNASGRLLGPNENVVNPIIRPTFEPEHWRISPADCTTGLGLDPRGLDVAAQPGSGWQGCRGNKGVKGPGAYVYEVACLEDGLVRVGWSTNDANLELGGDNFGFGFGSDAVGAAGINGQGRVMHRNLAHDYGVMVRQGDVIGCLLDLDKCSIAWSCNGKVFQRAFTIPEQLKGETFLPAASLRDSRLLFNFGEQSLEFPPGGSFVPLGQTTDDNQVPNRNPGWRMNQYDATPGMDVAPDGGSIQSHIGTGWQGCRANQGVRGLGRFYFEVTPVEANGLWRIGWTTDDGNLIVGTDEFGFAYGADHEGFGLNGQQGKRMHADEIENYGEAFTKDDVIGCFIDTIEHTIRWSKNGIDLGDAYKIPNDMINPKSLTALYPTISLLNSTMELNFGEKSFKYYPGPDWTPLCCAPPDRIKRSRRKGPERKVKGWSYVDPMALNPFIRQQMQLGQAAAAIGAARALERQEEDLLHSTPVSTADNQNGMNEIDEKKLKRTSPISRHPPAGAIPMPGMVPLSNSSLSSNSMFTSPVKSSGDLPTGTTSATIPSMTNKSSATGQLVNESLLSVTSNESPNNQTPSPLSGGAGGIRARRVRNGETVYVEHSEPSIETDTFIDESGKVIKRTVKRSEITTTKTVSERIITTNGHSVTADDSSVPNEFDEALDMALLEVTKLDRDISVLNDSVDQVEILTKPGSTMV